MNLAVCGSEFHKSTESFISNHKSAEVPLYDLKMTRIVIVGGAGHVGLPLALAFAETGHETVALDISEQKVELINSGKMPFFENGAQELLSRTLKEKTFNASTDHKVIESADVLVVVIGTPVDEHLNPDPNAVVNAVSACMPYMNSKQLIILRSTVFPGVTERVKNLLATSNLFPEVTFCPERILEGHALKELRELPQIIGATSESGAQRASELFIELGVKTIVVTPEEAELAKLFTNVWRYIKFAAANQFWLMSNEAGLDFSRIREAITFEYPRAADLPNAGFSAGPCLFKDTMQLAAFSNNNFALGHSAMQVNEGLPLYLVSKLEERFDLKNLTVGVLGAAFKGESDDIRSSLSYKLKKILQFRAQKVLMTDPYVSVDTNLISLEETIEKSDVLIIGAPHNVYKNLVTTKPIIDIWNLLGNGNLI
jgi:UDP-N-acetyl-D-mannosaminuronic acid dehydrogenase